VPVVVCRHVPTEVVLQIPRTVTSMEPCTVIYKVCRQVPIYVPVNDPCSPIHSYLTAPR
jgi:hypothetical protein